MSKDFSIADVNDLQRVIRVLITKLGDSVDLDLGEVANSGRLFYRQQGMVLQLRTAPFRGDMS